MTDYSTEELEKIADKFRSDTSGIRGTKDFTSPEELYAELKKEIKKYHLSDDTMLVDKAYSVAYDAHKGQARKSGAVSYTHLDVYKRQIIPILSPAKRKTTTSR